MRLRNFFLGGVVLAALARAAAPDQSGVTKPLTSIANRPWPAPYVASEPDRPPALSPAEAMKTFHMPPGYHLELVASEPLVQDPILAEFDGDGRLWVMEMQGFAYNDRMDNSFEPVNDLVILEDTNGDGVYDKRTVFLDKLIMPRAFKILDRNCALVGEPPNLWKACDTTGDLKADTKELIDKTFATQGVIEHGANGLYWGMDNRIYVAEHTWNLGYRAGKFATQPTLNRGQWGVTQDDAGHIYRDVNTDALFVDYVGAHYYSRNPNLVRTDGLYQSLVKQEDSNIWPIHPTLGINRGYRAEMYRRDGSVSYYQGVSSPLIFRGDQLPKELHGQAFVVDGPTNIVHLLSLKNDGSGNLAAADYYRKGEFLASSDVRFRPVSLTPGWDGSFLIVDMYRGVSQDAPLQTDYLRDFILKHDLQKSVNLGRIYRVVHDRTGKVAKPAMSRETPAQLVAHLSNPNGWWRDTAQQLLVQRNDRSVVPALKQLAASAPDWRARLQALWTLDGLESVDQASVLQALQDTSADVRAAAVRLSERWLAEDGPVRTAVLARMNDSHWQVRRQLAASLGEMPRDARLAPVIAMLDRYARDSITVDIAVSSLSGQESEALSQILSRPAPKGEAVMVLAGAASKGRNPEQLQSLVMLASDAKLPTPVRVAVLNGLSVGLQGAVPTPGGVADGRAGTGVPGVVTAPRRRSGPFEMATAPTGIIELAGRSGPLAEAAKPVLALLTWPGKPAPPPVAPLTAADQRRFNTGKALYEVNCVGCHLAEGQGQPRVSGPLAGSKIVNGAADVMIRVLINGKEGTIGLMPPLGSTMSDDDLAAVITFVRRSWGNRGDPVVPALVKEMRLAYAHRATPWTDQELAVRAR